MISCDGLCSRYDCAGINDVPSGEWICLCCTIKKTRSVPVFRHIPKEARMQTAEALSTIIKENLSGDADLLSWGNFYFLAVPLWPFLTHLVIIPLALPSPPL